MLGMKLGEESAKCFSELGSFEMAECLVHAVNTSLDGYDLDIRNALNSAFSEIIQSVYDQRLDCIIDARNDDSKKSE